MKNHLIIILFLMLAIKTYSQGQTSNFKVDNYFNFLSPYTESESNLKELQKISKGEIKHLIKLKYEAYEDNYRLLKREILNQVKKIRSAKKGITYGILNGAINSEIDKRYSKNFRRFLEIPFLMKAKVNSIKDSVYRDNDPQNPFSMNIKVMEFTVMEVLKGQKEFQEGKIYKCYYGSGWRGNAEEFINGMTYLLSLELRGPEGDENIVTLIPYLDDNCGLYKIEDDKLLDKYNFFSLGISVPWPEFVSGFNKKVESIKREDF
ncbi:MAG TPA: hypothetical protein VHO03_19805 [Ignavibacteriales bacterium]|nr:hypothetical protein [Ignavibacteriales bacterium]